MNFTALGEMLKNSRISANFTQTDVAKALGVTAQNVSSWERAKSKIDIEKLELICTLYEIDLIDILNSLSKSNSKINNLKETQLIEYYRDSEPAIQDAAFNMLKDSAKKGAEKAKNDELKQKRAT